MKVTTPLSSIRLSVGFLGLLLALTAGFSQSTNTANPPSPADLAWRELQSVLQPPPVPSEWKGKEPTPAQIEAYRAEQGRLAGLAADKARDFIAKYPDSGKAAEAKRQYARMLQTAVALGNKERATELEKVQADRLQDPTTPEDEKFRIRSQQVLTEARAQLAPGENPMTAYEKAARQLMKEFPKRSEPYQILMSVAEGSEGAHAKELLAEIAAAEAAGEVREQAKTVQAKYERVGKPLDIKFKATNGQEVDLATLKGKVVLVDFWATWCGPCVKEIPNVRAAYEKLHPKGFEIVGISFDSDRKKLDDFIAKEKLPWVQYYDGKGWSNEFGRKFGINSIPAMWLIDKKGNLRDLSARADLESKVEKLLAE
jgi:peroxiredoxin